MAEHRNIARLARNGPQDYLSTVVGVLDDRVTTAAHDLYPIEGSHIATQKGEWQVFLRKQFSVPYFLEQRPKPKDGFCAVYTRGGKAKTLFLGDNTGKSSNIEAIARELSQNVLEQRRFFAWPPRKLTEEYGIRYITNTGLEAGVATLLIPLLDMGVKIYTHNSEYVSLIERFAKYMGSMGEVGALVLLAAPTAYIAGILAASLIFGRRIGIWADNYRVRNLSSQTHSDCKLKNPYASAAHYSFGPEAQKIVLNEHSVTQEELRKTRIYETLTNAGVEVSKEYFSAIYQAMGQIGEEGVGRVKDILASGPKPAKPIPLDTVVEAFAAAAR